MSTSLIGATNLIGNRERRVTFLKADDPLFTDQSLAKRDWERALARGRQPRVPISDRAKVVDTYHGRCLYCGEECGDDGHIDHVIPVVRGGSNASWNLALACGSCNLRKRDRTPWELGDMWAMDLAWLMAYGLVDVQWLE